MVFHTYAVKTRQFDVCSFKMVLNDSKEMFHYNRMIFFNYMYNRLSVRLFTVRLLYASVRKPLHIILSSQGSLRMH